LAGCWN